MTTPKSFHPYEFAKHVEMQGPVSVVHFKKQFRKYLRECDWPEATINFTLREEYADRFFDAFLQSLRKQANAKNPKKTEVDIVVLHRNFNSIFEELEKAE